MSTTNATNTAPLPGGFPELDPRALDRGYEALAALQVLDLFRALSPVESEQVYAELQRAHVRMKSPRAREQYLILEDLRLIVDMDNGADSEDFLLTSFGITRSELRAYRRTWKTITEIHQAAEARAIEQAREAGELPPGW